MIHFITIPEQFKIFLRGHKGGGDFSIYFCCEAMGHNNIGAVSSSSFEPSPTCECISTSSHLIRVGKSLVARNFPLFQTKTNQYASPPSMMLAGMVAVRAATTSPMASTEMWLRCPTTPLLIQRLPPAVPLKTWTLAKFGKDTREDRDFHCVNESSILIPLIIHDETD